MPWSICSHRSRSEGLPLAPSGCSCAGCDDPMLSTWVISTIFIGLAATELIRVAYRSDLLSVPQVWNGPPFFIGDFVLTRETLWIIVGALFMAGTGASLFAVARFGRPMRAMAASARGAQLCGYSVNVVYAQAWFLGGTLAGFAGLFLAPVMGITPELADIMIVPGLRCCNPWRV